jgi:hypothetical protein
MIAAYIEDFIRQILKEDTVSDFNLYGIMEKILSNISIIENNKICLN